MKAWSLFPIHPLGQLTDVRAGPERLGAPAARVAVAAVAQAVAQQEEVEAVKAARVEVLDGIGERAVEAEQADCPNQLVGWLGLR